MELLKVGEILDDRYRVISQLGAGGMGTVYLCEHEEARRRVAIKIIHPESLKISESSMSSFLKEFKALARLNHAHIVTFYNAAITETGVPYAVCEAIEGVSLRQLLREQRKLSWIRCKQISLQICDALAYAHKQGIVHRDLKPENIMLACQPEPDWVKIVDFGLARVLDDNLRPAGERTTTGVLVGSPHYMSPEQCKGGRADARSDIYALGCIIYECLTGLKLVDADSAIAIIHKHVHKDLDSILLKELGASKELRQFLSSVLNQEPSLRLSSMEAVSRAIEQIEGQNVISRGSMELRKYLPAVSLLVVIALSTAMCIMLHKSPRSLPGEGVRIDSSIRALPPDAGSMKQMLSTGEIKVRLKNIALARRWLHKNAKSPDCAGPASVHLELHKLLKFTGKAADAESEVALAWDLVKNLDPASSDIAKLKSDIAFEKAIIEAQNGNLDSCAQFDMVSLKNLPAKLDVSEISERIQLLLAAGLYEQAERSLGNAENWPRTWLSAWSQEKQIEREKSALDLLSGDISLALGKYGQAESSYRDGFSLCHRAICELGANNWEMRWRTAALSYRLAYFMPAAEARANCREAIAMVNSNKQSSATSFELQAERSIWNLLSQCASRIGLTAEAVDCAKKRCYAEEHWLDFVRANNTEAETHREEATLLNARYVVARRLLQAKQQQQAIDTIQKILLEDSIYKNIDCYCLAGLSAFCFEHNEPEAGENLLEHALGKVSLVGFNKSDLTFRDYHEPGHVCAALARAYFAKGKHAIAASYFTSAITSLAATKNGDVFRPEECDLLSPAGVQYLYELTQVAHELCLCNDYDRALKLVDDSFSKMKKLKTPAYFLCRASLKNTWAQQLLTKGQAEKALSMFEASLSDLKQSPASDVRQSPTSERLDCMLSIAGIRLHGKTIDSGAAAL